MVFIVGNIRLKKFNVMKWFTHIINYQLYT